MDIFLREIQQSDVPTINKWRNDVNIMDCLGAPFRYINIETDEKWFESYMSTRNNNIRLAICDVENAKLLGVVYLLQIDWINRSAEYAIQIGETLSQGGGVGYKSTINILKHAFYDINLHKIVLYVVENNQRAIRLYEKIGFVQEGRLRQSVFKNGRYFDVIVMSILNSEYIAKYKDII